MIRLSSFLFISVTFKGVISIPLVRVSFFPFGVVSRLSEERALLTYFLPPLIHLSNPLFPFFPLMYRVIFLSYFFTHFFPPGIPVCFPLLSSFLSSYCETLPSFLSFLPYLHRSFAIPLSAPTFPVLPSLLPYFPLSPLS